MSLVAYCDIYAKHFVEKIIYIFSNLDVIAPLFDLSERYCLPCICGRNFLV